MGLAGKNIGAAQAHGDGELSLEAEQHAERINFEAIGSLFGILAGKQRTQMIEEDFAGPVVAEHLFLHGFLRPLGKGRALQLEHAFIEKRDQGEEGKLDHFA